MRGVVAAALSHPIEKTLAAAIVLSIAVLMTTPYYYLALFVPLAVIFLMFLNRYPSFGYYVIVFIVPFGAYRTLSEVGHIKIHYILAVMLLLYLLFKSFNLRAMPAELRGSIWRYIGVLFALTLVTALYSPYPDTAYFNVVQFLGAMTFIALGMYFIDREAFIRHVPAVVVLSVSLSSFLGVIGYVFNISFFAEKIVEGEFKRSLGGAADPNNTALMIAFALPLLAGMHERAKSNAYKFFLAALYVMNVLAMVFTFSRGGAIITILITIVVFYRRFKRINVQLIFLQIFLVLLLAALVLGALPKTYMQHFGNIANKKADASIERRSSYYTVAMDAFVKHPIMGTGLGTFREIYAESDFARKFSRKGDDVRRFAHNTYLEYLVGLSLIGLLCFIALEVRILLNFNAARKKFLKQGDEEMVSSASAYMFAFIVLAVNLFIFSEVFHKDFLIVTALSHAAYRLSLERPT
ncbi:MAG: O-antigen ligase family protein [Candidatus Magnetominusculus sp. LBB02]|nr:O-antigen ligase family protein [Candidatus Magnetominusculus sp. LBB02]